MTLAHSSRNLSSFFFFLKYALEAVQRELCAYPHSIRMTYKETSPEKLFTHKYTCVNTPRSHGPFTRIVDSLSVCALLVLAGAASRCALVHLASHLPSGIQMNKPPAPHLQKKKRLAAESEMDETSIWRGTSPESAAVLTR